MNPIGIRLYMPMETRLMIWYCPEGPDTFSDATAGAWASVQGLCGEAGGGATQPKTLRTGPYREEVTPPPPSQRQTFGLHKNEAGWTVKPSRWWESPSFGSAFSFDCTPSWVSCSWWKQHKSGRDINDRVVEVMQIYFPLYWDQYIRPFLGMKGEASISVNTPWAPVI